MLKVPPAFKTVFQIVTKTDGGHLAENRIPRRIQTPLVSQYVPLPAVRKLYLLFKLIMSHDLEDLSTQEV